MQEAIPILSVSCVYYDTQPEIFRNTLDSLHTAVLHAKAERKLDGCILHVINNNPDNENIFIQVVSPFKEKFDDLIVHNGHGNIGYGRGNNLAIKEISSDYHLILNPDVIQAVDTLSIGIDYLQNHSNVGLVAPSATNQHGEIEYLAKRAPTFLVLFLRALDNSRLNNWFKKPLDIYAYKDKILSENEFEIELASGCFMLTRSKILMQAGGFSESYFMYFEDFDLSQKIKAFSNLVYFRSIKIIHYGGYSSKKGIRHIMMFLSSFLRYKFNR